jgi:hypothetical protein
MKKLLRDGFEKFLFTLAMLDILALAGILIMHSLGLL